MIPAPDAVRRGMLHVKRFTRLNGAPALPQPQPDSPPLAGADGFAPGSVSV